MRRFVIPIAASLGSMAVSLGLTACDGTGNEEGTVQTTTPAAVPTARGSGEAPGGGDAAAMQDAATPVDEAALLADARATVKALGGPLKQQLQAAMQAGGPDGAMQVCQQIAPELAREVSAAHNMQIRRVSLRNRNPQMGVPAPWEAGVLRSFDERQAAGEDAASLHYSAIVDDQYRYMQAIPTEAVCLRCHGSELAPEVVATLEELYPDDRATGYEVGEVRGAFVVTKDLGGP